jgi:hypothetical protein
MPEKKRSKIWQKNSPAWAIMAVHTLGVIKSRFKNILASETIKDIEHVWQCETEIMVGNIK